MANGTTLTITRVLVEADMRGVHRMRSRVHCGPGQAWLFVNKTHRIARVVGPFRKDIDQGVFNFYAQPGRMFDVDTIKAAVAVFGLTIAVQPQHVSKVVGSLAAARRRAAARRAA